MGCCVVKPKLNKIFKESTSDLTYPRTISIQIKKKGSRGRVQSVETVTFNHTEPILCVSEEVSIHFLTWASGNSYSACILPGTDPHEKVFKACQDLCFFSSDGKSIILGLFDGHGKEGEHLSSLCIQEADDFFHKNISDYENKPNDFLLHLLQSILNKLKEPGLTIDVISSGCSCVLTLIHKDSIHTMNIGNSRAVLGTFQTSLEIDPRHITGIQERKVFNELSNRRRGSMTKQIVAVQMTVDHTTSNHSEFMRIIKAGGKLHSPEAGDDKDSTYLVYAPHSNIPGIKLTRSIGDSIAIGIGIVPKPDCYKHILTCENEFVVLASEGVWEVMRNEEVVEFVAKYRILANRKLEKPIMGQDVTPHNSCIAQLLCEEARIRWLRIVENNDTLIEDISCVVLEIDQRVEKRSNTFYRMEIQRIGSMVEKMNSLKVI